MNARVHSVETFGLVDGPGVRFMNLIGVKMVELLYLGENRLYRLTSYWNFSSLLKQQESIHVLIQVVHALQEKNLSSLNLKNL